MRKLLTPNAPRKNNAPDEAWIVDLMARSACWPNGRAMTVSEYDAYWIVRKKN